MDRDRRRLPDATDTSSDKNESFSDSPSGSRRICWRIFAVSDSSLLISVTNWSSLPKSYAQDFALPNNLAFRFWIFET